ncbi:MAG: hypothetical protein EOP06_17440 [Proteobacteria bacterium]|nr:MAG: hypothetical protein EOP06_17440 [Pseudomonadota bacterium]
MRNTKSPSAQSPSPRKYPDADLKILYGNAAALCGFPNCRKPCILDGTKFDKEKNIGKIAHIVAHSNTGPRADPSVPMSKRDCYSNWILLCPTHHDTVDVQPNTFTVADLRKWKSDHESWVRSRTRDQIPNVGFAELDEVCKAVITQPTASTSHWDSTLTAPVAKMRKNNLTEKSEFSIMTGLAGAGKVKDFINRKVRLDLTFPDRLRSGFIKEYNVLYGKGLRGDDLFAALQQFAAGGSFEFNYQAASLQVLSYLFEQCDVFER